MPGFGVRQIAVTNQPQVCLGLANSFASRRARLANIGATDVFIGGPDLTNANTATKGEKIAATSGTLDIVIDPGEVVYVCTASGTSTLVVRGST
jgi:hypothetical protein